MNTANPINRIISHVGTEKPSDKPSSMKPPVGAGVVDPSMISGEVPGVGVDSTPVRVKFCISLAAQFPDVSFAD